MPGMRRLELHLSYVCAQRCAFCSESRRMARWRAHPPTGREVAAVLRERRRAGFDHVTFTGGEPTAHPLLPKALAAAKAMGFTTYITSNGGRLARESYARAVLPFIDELCVSVHGPDAAAHDAQTGAAGSFSGALAALANAERLSATTRLLTNTVATRLNWERLPETLAFVSGLRGVTHCLISNVAPEGRAASAYERLAVPLERWRAALPRLTAAFRGARGAALRFFGLPLCVLDGRRELSNDAHFSPRVTVERRAVGGAPGLAAVASLDASRRRRKPAACSSCSAAAACAGVFERYLDAWGDGELRPLGGRA